MRLLLILLTLSSCMKYPEHRTEPNGLPTQKTCSTEWVEDGEHLYIDFEIPAEGLVEIVGYAELVSDFGSQGLTWEFIQDGQTTHQVSTSSEYYQGFYDSQNAFFSMWNTSHSFNASGEGVLRVRRYAYWTQDESVCVHFTPALIDETEK